MTKNNTQGFNLGGNLDELLEQLQVASIKDLVDLLKNKSDSVTASDRMAILNTLKYYGVGLSLENEKELKELDAVADEIFGDTEDFPEFENSPNVTRINP